MNQLGASKGGRDELQSFSYDPNQVDEGMQSQGGPPHFDSLVVRVLLDPFWCRGA